MHDENGNNVRMLRYDNKGKIVEWNETIYDANHIRGIAILREESLKGL